MKLLQGLSRRVHGCFRRVERWGDRVTGAAGPFFVLIAALLIPTCVLTYYDIVFPHRFLQHDTHLLTTLIGFSWSTYIVYSIFFHYIMAIAIPAGSPLDRSPVQHQFPSLATIARSISRLFTMKRVSPRKLDEQPDAKRSEDLAMKRLADGSERHCKKCPLDANGQPVVKPERTHHCKVCGQCWLKFDHHCPWINACVGLHNERYFVLFMSYLAVGCACVVDWGWTPMLRAVLDQRNNWSHRMPRACMLLLWITCVALGFAIGIMALWQLWSISRGETSVESNDNDWYRKLAQSRGRTYVNPYDLGWSGNLAFFFGVGQGRRPWYTILIPRPYAPAGDGWTWPKRAGWQANAEAIAAEEELTDEELEDE